MDTKVIPWARIRFGHICSKEPYGTRFLASRGRNGGSGGALELEVNAKGSGFRGRMGSFRRCS